MEKGYIGTKVWKKKVKGMSLSRAEDRRRYRDDRKRIFKKVFWLIAIVTVGGTLGTWLWEWTGEPVFFE